MSYEYDPGHRMVETFPESHGTTTQKNLRCHAFETIERGCRECDKILMIYPSVQEVFYEVENLKEPMYNGCRVGNTTLYSLKGFCELLNGQTAEVRDAGIGEALS